MSDVRSENNPAPDPWTASQRFEEQVATTVPLPNPETVATYAKVVREKVLGSVEHSGPLPSPEVLASYENMLPGSAERIYADCGEPSASLKIPEALMNDLRTSAFESGISVEEALRRSIATTKLLRQEVREGNKILIRDRKGKYQEVVFLG